MTDAEQAITTRTSPVYIVGVVFLVAGLLFYIYRLAGFAALIPFTVCFGGGMVAWLLTTYRHTATPNRLLVPYLMTLFWYHIHCYEEYIGRIDVWFRIVMGHSVSQHDVISLTGYIFPAVWTLGAVLLWKRHPFGNYLAWAFFIGMTFGELGHFVFIFLGPKAPSYVAGVYTAAPLILCGSWGFYRIITDFRSQTKGASSA